MIRTATQLKALVKNKSGSDSNKAQTIIRCYMMERLLERIALSKYSRNFVLKGGFLIASIVGLDTRTTMDIDGTVKNLPLTIDTAQDMIEEIISIPLDDNTVFSIKSIGDIMDESEYGGIRISLEAQLESMRTSLKVDISTGDVITPREISHQHKLMFEDRSISVLAYNMETILAEKLETVISRGASNTRMRDFYDLYILTGGEFQPVDDTVFKAAVEATSKKRDSAELFEDGRTTLDEVHTSTEMQDHWRKYQNKYEYAKEILWDEVLTSIRNLFEKATS